MTEPRGGDEDTLAPARTPPHTGRRSRLVWGVRWATLGSLLAGYAVTEYADPVFRVEYAVCTLVSMAAFFLLLTRLNRGARATLPFWLLFLYMWLAYYVKFYWLAISPEVGLDLMPFRFSYSSPVALESAFTTITVACAGIFATAWLLIGGTTGGRGRPDANVRVAAEDTAQARHRRIGTAALWLAVGLSAAATVITLRTGISVMGVEGPSLPYHASGIVYLARNVLIPALLLLAFWAALEAGLRRRMKVVFGVIVVFGVMEMLLRSSRGALAPLVLSVAFLLILKGQIKRYRSLLVASALLVVVLHPVLSVYRNLRIHATDADLGQLLSSASKEVFAGGNTSLGETVALGATALSLRATGAEILIWYDDFGMRPLGDSALKVVTSPRGVAGYLTVGVFGFPADAVNEAAPGVVGWFYLVGGNGFVFLGLVAFTLLVHGLWRGLLRLHLRTEPVAQALFLTWLTLLTMDGVLESVAHRTILIWPLSILACEWIARTMERRGGRRRASAMVRGALQSVATHPET